MGQPNLVGVEASPPQEVVDRSLDLVVPPLGVVDRLLISLTDSNNHLLDTKRVRQKNVLLVWPFFKIPASYSDDADATSSTTTTACDVLVVVFLMKSRWPGASLVVK